VEHPDKGALGIFDVLALEFAASVEEVTASVRDSYATEKKEYSWAAEKYPGWTIAGRETPRVFKVYWERNAHGEIINDYHPSTFICNTKREANIGGFIAGIHTHYFYSGLVAIRPLIEEWLDDDREFLEIGPNPVLRKFTKDKTLHIAHQEVTYERLFVELPVMNPEYWGRQDDPATAHTKGMACDITNLKDKFVQTLDWFLNVEYNRNLGSYMRDMNFEGEKIIMQREWDKFLRASTNQVFMRQVNG
jgi:hypothetical protein